MTKSPLQETAKIYQFPIRDRAAKIGHRESQSVADLASVRGSDCSGWYHEAAIREAEQARKYQPR